MKGIAFQCGALVLVAVPMTLLEAAWSGEQGHLPWPALQWTVTTPVGALVLMALFLLAVGPPGILLNRWQLRREVGRAVDVTDVPPAAWPGLRQARPQQPVLQRWLGNGACHTAIS